MRRHYRNIALALSLGLATVTATAFAQSNPMARGNSEQAAAPRSEPIGRSQFGQHGMARPQPRNSVVNVTPVPEPGQWAMMLAGLALVGWIVRRNSKR